MSQSWRVHCAPSELLINYENLLYVARSERCRTILNKINLLQEELTHKLSRQISEYFLYSRQHAEGLGSQRESYLNSSAHAYEPPLCTHCLVSLFQVKFHSFFHHLPLCLYIRLSSQHKQFDDSTKTEKNKPIN